MDLALVENIWHQASISPEYLAEMQQVCFPTTKSSNSLTQLPLLFCELNGGNKQHIVPIITAWNILRFAARLLDDIEDNDVKDRAMAKPIALNVSTGLLFTVGQILNSLEATGVHPEIASDIRHTFYKELLKICSGQHLDLRPEIPTIDACWQICGAKSGAFIGLICWAGGRVANANQEQLELYYQFGYNLGLLDEIRDDLADLWADDFHHSDLQNSQHYSLPIAYALSVLPEDKNQKLRACLQHKSFDPDIEIMARELIVQSGAGVYLTVQSTYYFQHSQQLLEKMDLPEEALHKLKTVLNKARLPIVET